MNFLNRKKCISSAISQKYDPNGPVDITWYIFGSGNGLARDWWQAITWTTNDQIFVTIWCHRAIMS